jgi:hypothetical protein
MPIQTDLSVSPYFDDYAESKNYYKVLFKPSVAVQVRELNQLQSMLQGQVEKFGDAIFKRGTIIEGCNFTFNDTLKYVRIKDNEIDGTPVNVSVFKNLFVKDSDNLTAYIIETTEGFESQSPDLNTLYIRYTNAGNTYSKAAFDKNTILTVYDKTYPITKALVSEGSTGFSNNDTLVVYPAIAVQNSTGGSLFAPNTWVINSKIVQDTTGAEAEILAVNTTANSSVLVLNIRPLETDLDDAAFDANNWTLSSGYTITGATLGATTANSSANGLIVAIIGADAQGTLLTDGTGKITQVAISATGSGYYVPPHITVASPTGAIESANIVPYNYQAKVTVQNDDSAIGNSYGLTVSQGLIYQKGYFSRVATQLVIVEKYASATTPDEKVVGFNTIETITTSDEDQTLLDNALGSFNYTAPGADRVQLTPTLVVLDKADALANTEFLPLVEFAKGAPYKQVRGTLYSKLNQELAQRTYEESGNYILDQFRSSTSSSEGNEDTKFNVVVDPGKGYILGNRIETVETFQGDVDKGTSTISASNVSLDLDYGYYIRVKELGGYFQFNTGDVISLRDTALQYASNTTLAGTEPAAPGSEIGKARMKILSFEGGEPGSTATYRLYLWAVQMNTGKNFADVRSVYYDGASYKGYADIVTDAGKAVIYDSSKSELIFKTGFSAVKLANNVTYTYRSVNAIATANTTGVINAAAVAGSWTYTGELTTAQQSELIIIPLTSMETANLGTASVGAGSTSNTTVVLSNATFGDALSIGDYIKVYGTSDRIRKVVGITNATHITVDSGLGLTNTSSNVSFIVPKYTSLQLATRPDRSANIDGSYLRVYINPPANFVAGANVAVSYNAKRSSIPVTSKNTFRNSLVKLNITSNPGGVNGPWYLGVPDIFRLRNVYVSSSSTVNTDSTNITNEFFIDHNQTENSYDGGYLFKRPESTYTIGGSDYLLVQFDAFDKTGGIYSISSYSEDDSANLATLSATATDVNRLEIPEVYTSIGTYHDLTDVLDFRISANTTANIVTSATSPNITTNPALPAYADRYNDADEKYFPIPQGDLTLGSIEAYQGRIDRVIVNSNSDIVILKGDSGSSTSPSEPLDALTINILNVPPYPSLPKFRSGELIEIIDRRVANIKYTNRREKTYSITENTNEGNIIYQQPRAYKMTDIASIDRRLSNVENRIDLKAIEDDIKNLTIPSSVDATTDRFKFGFFVDNFTTTDYSDLDDPEYSAMNFDYRMTSMKSQQNIKFVNYSSNVTPTAVESDGTVKNASGDLLTLPFEEYSIIRQLAATAIDEDSANTTTSQQTSVFEHVALPKEADKFTLRKNVNAVGGYLGPQFKFVMSRRAGPVTIYVAAPKKDGGVHLAIAQYSSSGSRTRYITSETAVSLTADDRNNLQSVKAFNNSYTGGGTLNAFLNNALTFKSISGRPKYYIRRSVGKFTFTHDPTKGQNYTILTARVEKNYAFRMEYPVDAVVGRFVDSGKKADKIKYNGRVISINPNRIDIVATIHEALFDKAYVSIKTVIDSRRRRKLRAVIESSDERGTKDQTIRKRLKSSTKIKASVDVAAPTKIEVYVKGLRPLTRHNFYVGKVLSNSKALARSGPLAGQFGTDTTSTSSLVSDITGLLRFDIYLDNKLPTGVVQTTYGELQKLLRDAVNSTYSDFSLKTTEGKLDSGLNWKIYSARYDIVGNDGQ